MHEYIHIHIYIRYISSDQGFTSGLSYYDQIPPMTTLLVRVVYSPTWELELDLMILMGPFQLGEFYYSMNLLAAKPFGKIWAEEDKDFHFFKDV